MNAMNFVCGLMLSTSIIFFSCDNEPAGAQPSEETSTAICSNPSNITVTRSTDTSMATVLWTANGDQTSWQLQYGTMGFALGSGTTVYSNAPSKIFPGLSENVSYDFYIRSKCSENVFSDWVGPISLAAVGVIITEEYWPRAAQNQWIFAVDNINQQPWKITGTEVIDSNEYYVFQPIADQPQRKIRKSAVGDYFDRYEAYNFGGLTISGNETIILKDYLPVGGTWTNTYVETTTTPGMPDEVSNVEITSSILERDASVSVPAGTFNNVIIVKRVKSATEVGFPPTITTTTYWFAKNHGPVQVQTETETGIIVEKLTAHILY